MKSKQFYRAGHPKDAKSRLAKLVIADYHSQQDADEAADRWQREVGGGELPTDIPTVTLSLSASVQASCHSARRTSL